MGSAIRALYQWKRNIFILSGFFLLLFIAFPAIVSSQNRHTKASASPAVNLGSGFQSVDLAEGQKASVRLHTGTGVPSFLHGRIKTLPGLDPESAARRFFSANRALYRITDPARELVLHKQAKDRVGMTHLRFQQVCQGVPVLGAQLLVHLSNDGDITAVNGRYVPDMGMTAEPAVSAGEAAARAMLDLGLFAAIQGPDPQLAILNPPEQSPLLVWRIELVCDVPPVRMVYFVNAATGNILGSYDNLQRALFRKMYDAQNQRTLPGPFLFQEGGSSTDPVAQGTYNNVGTVYNYYKDHYGRDSFDDNGGTVITSIHFGNGETAYWNGTQIYFGDGTNNSNPLGLHLQIVGHEFTHGVTAYTADLIYMYESGAINDGYSDVMGTVIDKADWSNWPGFFWMDDMGDFAIQYPAHDYGGVHNNNNLVHKVAYLIGTAFENNLPTNQALDKMGHLFYHTLAYYLTPTSQFIDFRIAMVQSAASLYGPISSESSIVAGAFDAIDVTLTTPPTIDLGTPIGSISNSPVTFPITATYADHSATGINTAAIEVHVDGDPVTNCTFEPLSPSYDAQVGFHVVGKMLCSGSTEGMRGGDHQVEIAVQDNNGNVATHTETFFLKESLIEIADTPQGGQCLSVGSWDPGTKTCTLDRDLEHTRISIKDDGITLDGATHTMDGMGIGLPGIQVFGGTDVTIRSLTVKNFLTGVAMVNSTGCSVRSCTVRDCDYGILLSMGDNNELYFNIIYGNNIGVTLVQANSNILDTLYVGDSGTDGIYMEDSNNNIVRYSGIDGSGAAGIKLQGCSSVRVSTNTFMGNAQGIKLADSTGCTITKNQVRNSADGISLLDSDSNELTSNRTTSNNTGILLNRSDYNLVSECKVEKNSNLGISIYSLDVADRSTGNQVIDCICVENKKGIYLGRAGSTTISGNTVLNNTETGIDLYSTINSTIYDNRFLYNTVQAEDTAGSANAFYLPLPNGGNYWSDYDEPSEGCDDLNVNGFCDAAYSLSPGIVDSYPRTGATALTTLYIRDDLTGGDCALIGTWDDGSRTCSLTTDITAAAGITAIEIDANGITLQGAGHSITGASGGTGVLVDANTGVTIKNLYISGFGYGMHLKNAGSSSVEYSSCSGNTRGIKLYQSDGTVLSGNTVEGNANGGLYLQSSNDCTVQNNQAFANNEGLDIEYSDRTTVSNNTLSNNAYGAWLYYADNSLLYGNRFINNTLQAAAVSSTGNQFDAGLPDGGNFWSDYNRPAEGCDDSDSDGFCDSPYILIGGQDNYPWYRLPLLNTLNINDDTTGGDCLLVGEWDAPSKTCTLTTSLITESSMPIIRIADNSITLDGDGHTLEGTDRKGTGVIIAASNVTVTNLVLNNLSDGIRATGPLGATVNGNTISDFGRGIYWDTQGGNLVANTFINGSTAIMILESSANGLFRVNKITEAWTGITLQGTSHTVTGNTITGCDTGLNATNATACTVYNNTFDNTGTNARTTAGKNNLFFLPTPDGGNRWGDWDAPGEGCRDANIDGFCDAVYVFDGGQDDLPLAPPDLDEDGVLNSADNCPENPNGPDLGTCIAGTVGQTCSGNDPSQKCLNSCSLQRTQCLSLCLRDATCEATCEMRYNDCSYACYPCGSDGACSMAQDDADGDGIGDICDPCTDTDADGVCEDQGQDSCPGIPNGPELGTCISGDTGATCNQAIYEPCAVDCYDTYQGCAKRCVTQACFEACQRDYTQCLGQCDFGCGPEGECLMGQTDSDRDGTGDACDPCTDADHDGYCAWQDDCDDGNPKANPDEKEVCDGVDNDCDGLVDEVCSSTTTVPTTTTTSVQSTTTSVQPTTTTTSIQPTTSTTSVQPTTTTTVIVSCPNYDKIRALVREYYLDILDREPDAGGWDYWSGEICRIIKLGIYVGEGFQAEARFFFNSKEYLDKGKSDKDFVIDLYQTFLQREPDAGGLDYWVGQLSCLTRNMLITQFAYSDEFKLYMSNLFGPDTTRPENNMVNDFYRGFMNRFPDDGGYNAWLAEMRLAQCKGAAAVQELSHQLSLLFVQSAEYKDRKRDNVEYVEDLYNGILRRGADCNGFVAWVKNLDAGMSREEMLKLFTDSPEFQIRVDAVIAAGCILK